MGVFPRSRKLRSGRSSPLGTSNLPVIRGAANVPSILATPFKSIWYRCVFIAGHCLVTIENCIDCGENLFKAMKPLAFNSPLLAWADTWLILIPRGSSNPSAVIAETWMPRGVGVNLPSRKRKNPLVTGWVREPRTWRSISTSPSIVWTVFPLKAFRKARLKPEDWIRASKLSDTSARQPLIQLSVIGRLPFRLSWWSWSCCTVAFSSAFWFL